ncbi:hypothetical protein [Halobacterium rubrum]|uniref:hypothetical protein n=1 Tax=Halobacterium TaxID=2239 RepID=UPI001F43653C|nr:MULTISPECIES: hypothetical protein [Halobacterium]MDH5020352.1 hypothetical protein [Halobacterium rubrum]
MSEEFPEDVVELAEEYLDACNGDAASRTDEVQEELEYWQEQADEFEEGTPMHEMAVEERDEFQERLEKISEQGERRSELRTELLTRTSKEFAPQGDWIDETVISALTHALLSERRDRILIGDHAIPEDTDSLSKKDMVTIAKNVHVVAEHAVDSNETIDEVWEKMSTDKVLPITRTIARSDSPLSAGGISEKLGEDGPDDPGANLRYVITSSEYHPYYREDGEWTFSLLGEYTSREFGLETVEAEPETEDPEEEVEEDKQFSFDDISEEKTGDGSE